MLELKKIAVLFASLIFLCFMSNALEIYMERKQIKNSISRQFYDTNYRDVQLNNEKIVSDSPDSLDQSAMDYKFSREKYVNIN